MINPERYIESKNNGSEKDEFFEMWQKIREFDVNELTDSELYAMVHTAHRFYEKLSLYYRGRV